MERELLVIAVADCRQVSGRGAGAPRKAREGLPRRITQPASQPVHRFSPVVERSSGFFVAAEHAGCSRIRQTTKGRKIVRIFLIALALSTTSLAFIGQAEARGYRYCLKTSAGPGDCKYSSYRQCQASASGTFATCVRNYGRR
ncbi:MAG: DUF3551 domain-containing protein [Candidatus Afipia apatlaquensis]|uniref:DUF3551 domain-containing protein n=1 Tax=Candidatus Afipia apatlaquensis TaxID=2712852 RepID=A0A7C9VQR2_9BRAD|nr:DUF3551 domain-containing protein [Candidatus Afipia apatlaquensis]